MKFDMMVRNNFVKNSVKTSVGSISSAPSSLDILRQHLFAGKQLNQERYTSTGSNASRSKH